MLPDQRLHATHALTTWNIFNGMLDFHWYAEYNVGDLPLCCHWCVLGNLKIYTMVVCVCVWGGGGGRREKEGGGRGRGRRREGGGGGRGQVCIYIRCKESAHHISVVVGSLLRETVINGSMKALGDFSPILSMVMVR